MSRPPQVDVQHHADHTILVVHGRVFIDTIHPLRAALAPLLDADRPRIIVDLSDVDLCDSSGLNLIATSHQTAATRDGWLRVVGLQPMVRRAIEATNLNRLLFIHATIDDAIHGRHPAAETE
jgi:anti-sigma B factor antagonist